MTNPNTLPQFRTVAEAANTIWQAIQNDCVFGSMEDQCAVLPDTEPDRERFTELIAELLTCVPPPAQGEAPSWDFEKLKPLMRADYREMSEPEWDNHWRRVTDILTDALKHGGLRTPSPSAPVVSEDLVYRAACAVQSCRGLINEPGTMLKKEVRAALTAAFTSAQPAAVGGANSQFFVPGCIGWPSGCMEPTCPVHGIRTDPPAATSPGKGVGL